MKLRTLGLCGIISLISYAAMVFFSPLAYPGYDWLTMAVSDLGAVGAPSAELADRLSAFYGPAGIVGIMAVCVAVANVKSKLTKIGVYLFALMQWIVDVGYDLFPWISGRDFDNFQNIMHLVVTASVVIFSIASLVCIFIGCIKTPLKSLGIWAIICLAAMFIGAIGTGAGPKSLFGLFERFSCFAAVVFNAILGLYLFKGKFEEQE